MKNLKEKKGISLIVLVITIIVMIILAAAIILSISNSGIMDKANKAKEDSDTANLKEYVNVLEAEWELGTKGTSKEAYVNGKLEDKGYTSALFMEDGTLYTNLQANAKAALEAGITIGDVVKYDVTAVTKPSENANTGASSQDISNQTNLTWRYIGVSDSGEIMIAPDVTADAPKLSLYGTTGYLKGPDELNRLCDALYSTDKGTARSMTIEDVNNLLGYTGSKGSFYGSVGGSSKWIDTDIPLTIQQLISDNKGLPLDNTTTPDGKTDIGTYKSDYYIISKDSDKITNKGNIDYVYYGTDSDSYDYWLASRCVAANFSSSYADFRIRYVTFSVVDARDIYYSGDLGDVGTYSLRPVVSLKSNIQLTKVSEGKWSI